jgi:hypothetical protein
VRTDPAYSGFKRRDYPRAEEIETIEVRTEQLDDCLPVGYVPHLIKIDVEGAEQQVLEGAVGTIRLHKPIVIFEHGRGSAEYYGGREVEDRSGRFRKARGSLLRPVGEPLHQFRGPHRAAPPA